MRANSGRCVLAIAALLLTAQAPEDEDGRAARLLKFPRPGPPGPTNPSDTVSNIDIFPKTNDLTETAVDRENKSTCRTEARWRLEGAERRPVLLFWRETRDCDGKRGWAVRVDRREKR